MDLSDPVTPPTPQHQILTKAPHHSGSHLLRDESQWDHRDLHSYMLAHMSTGAKHSSNDAFTCRHFLKRWGNKAIPIIKYAFEVGGGVWHGRYVAPFMLLKSYDPFFAQEIERLLDAQ